CAACAAGVGPRRGRRRDRGAAADGSALRRRRWRGPDRGRVGRPRGRCRLRRREGSARCRCGRGARRGGTRGRAARWRAPAAARAPLAPGARGDAAGASGQRAAQSTMSVSVIDAGPAHAEIVAVLHAATIGAREISAAGADWNATWTARILALPGATAALAL